MKQFQYIFPHNTRVFTAALLWVSLSAIVIVNYKGIFQIQKSDNPIFTQLISDPFSPKIHMRIANIYDATKQSSSAQREILLVKDILNTKTHSVLGVTTEIRQSVDERETEPTRLKNELAYWEQIINEKPDYRDAYIQAAVITWKLGDTEKTAKLFNMISMLDPDTTFKQIFQIQ